MQRPAADVLRHHLALAGTHLVVKATTAALFICVSPFHIRANQIVRIYFCTTLAPKVSPVAARRRLRMPWDALVLALLQFSICLAAEFDGINNPIAATGPLAPWVSYLAL
jgi:hypothetical protein